MNREILFKTKRKDNGEWVEGDLLHTRHADVVLISDFEDQLFRCDGNTLCQYTGLADKNGKKIWENDICEMVYNGVVYVYVVVWDKTELDFKGTNGKENYGRNFEYLGCCEEIEVIGNIFDNPELLEVE